MAYPEDNVSWRQAVNKLKAGLTNRISNKGMEQNSFVIKKGRLWTELFDKPTANDKESFCGSEFTCDP